MKSNTPDAPSELLARISAYLMGGGLWHPELANHDAVRDLLIDCRDALAENFAPVSETTTNQRAACREDGSADSSKPNGSQDSPAAAHQTPRTDAFYECLGVIVDAEGVHDGLMKCRKHAEFLERQLAEAKAAFERADKLIKDFYCPELADFKAMLAPNDASGSNGAD